ncbi:ABC-2 type transport system ATP-binding protein [Saccharopolyspora lacisalsi]|uniref:ABC-2 type transport system ATP-binding protein n=1 Tax=Halosaccharopolyspora lacisalsi TaxID=1000566 RepID=A0A839DPH9_9PSEU|nr:ATP-binding cassette domain-containing protein [Halosaccharopolyspora lacisalsi]MBA8822963.1 ABC-2 type transport system ATP-binding protein [Halosaccharopolyspora lacisalsi]
MPTPTIVAESLVKRFGRHRALDGVNLEVPRGHILGLLGPNGAGKTTTVRVLSTLLAADSGRAEVAGYDCATEPAAVRSTMGLSGQYTSLDENLTGRENLHLVARLYGYSRARARERAARQLDRFGLTDAAHRRAGGYSGGMRRRLDLGGALIADPRVVVLDEPTTGLDPRARRDTWETVRGLVADGTTVLLTTQYLEEADQLADSIAVIDHGRVIATGAPAELKRRVRGERVEIVLADPADAPRTVHLLAGVGPSVSEAEPGRVELVTRDGSRALLEVLHRLERAGIPVADAGTRKPSLDDVFLSLTGQSGVDQPDTTDDPAPAGALS